MCICIDLAKYREERFGKSLLGEQLEAKAKELWAFAERPAGRDLEFWNDAEREIIGYTKEEFGRLYDLYDRFYGLFFCAPNIFAGSEVQMEALKLWGFNPWNLWTLSRVNDLFEESDPYSPHPFSTFDYNKKRPKRVARFFKQMETYLKSESDDVGRDFCDYFCDYAV